MTQGHAIVMGTGVYNELIEPLPNRHNVVATNKNEPLREGFEKTSDARAYLQNAQEDVWVVGGAAIFAATLDLVDELHLTLLDQDFSCTKFFPEYESAFEKTAEQQSITENGITFTITVWKRRI
jgi:dihydrofolate reductase